MSPGDKEIVAAIRGAHLRVNVGFYESHPRWFSVNWEDAHVDGLGGAPYLHVPIGARSAMGDSYIGPGGVRVRVYPTARLAHRLTRRYGYRWGNTWRTKPGAPKGWPKHGGAPRPEEPK